MFKYTDGEGNRLCIALDRDRYGSPIALFSTASNTTVNVVAVPTGFTEEVVAGIRDTVRQSGPAAVRSALATELPRRFQLLRHRDVSGISGTGVVALGVRWPDGTASVRWLGPRPSVVFWDQGMADAEYVHGHGGATEIVWLDGEA